MKRFKKLTIYILVGVLLSSSVMLSYRKVDEVKASATLTLGTGALIMLGILGAYGIVYKGNIDSSLDEYVWKGDRGLYPHEVQEAEEWWAQMWDNTVRQYASNNGYDPDNWNDDDNDLETQPPLWEKVIGTVEKNKRPLKLLATAFGYIASKLAFGVYQESQNNSSESVTGLILNVGDTLVDGCNHYQNTNRKVSSAYKINITQGSNIKVIHVTDGNSTSVYYLSDSPFQFNYQAVTNMRGNGTVGGTVDFVNISDYTDLVPYLELLQIQPCTSINYGGLYYYSAPTFSTSGMPITGSVLGNVFYNGNRADLHKLLLNDVKWNEINDDNSLINQENIGLGTDITIDNSNNELKPISPTITIPTASMLDKLLNDLENNYGNEGGTQQAVDDFIADLEYTEPSSEPEPDPEPDPNPEGGGGTTTDPDDGGEGGSGSADDKDNSSLLADLKNVFPFCIPFDLVNCFKLFNAEPVTPRVEIPLHFGIIDKDYTFVIDLKDFDGVAEVCRAMFLILFMVGLVLSTRSLIRG